MNRATTKRVNVSARTLDGVVGGSRRRAFQSAPVFVVLLLLVCAPILRAQAGVITTAVGYSLNDPSVTNAGFVVPTSVAIDSTGNIYTADPDNCVVWKTLYGTSSVFAGILTSSPYTCSSGAATTVATTTPLAYPSAVAQCNGNVFVASLGIDPFVVGGSTEVAGTVDEVGTNGSLSALPLPGAQGGGGGPIHPVAIACDSSGNVYVSAYFYISDGSFASNVYEFSPATGGTSWTTVTLVNGLFDQAYPAIAVNPANGDLYGILAGQAGEGWLGPPSFGAGSIWNITENSSGLSSNNTFTNGSALAIDANGNFYIAQSAIPEQEATYVDFVQPPNGITTVVAGNGELGYNGDGILSTRAEVYGVSGIALDSTDGYIYLADSGNQRVRRIHSLTAGPAALSLVSSSVSQTSGATYGSQQGALNLITGDFYYVTGTNTVNVINTGTDAISPGYERIVASINVGAAGQAAYGSALTMAVDSTHNLVYAMNSADGTLYVINGSSHTVAGSIDLYTPTSGASAASSLLAVDTGLNEIYVTAPYAVNLYAVSGGTTPQLLGTTSGLDAAIASISVDTVTHVVYAVGEGSEGYGGYLESLFTFTPDPTTGVLSVNTSQFPIDEVVLQPNFIANSIAVDPQTGSLIASGAASIDTGFSQTYDVYDIFEFTPFTSEAPVPYSWPPITTSLDVPNRDFYITDFDGDLLDPSSHATMVTGMDTVAVNDNSLDSVTIPVFGSGTTPTSPHVYDIEPDTSSYQAWISGSDATDGGFVKLWDSSTQAVTESVAIPNNGGGHLFVNSSAQAAYLLDEVNAQLWLIDTPGWTPTPAPQFSLAPNGASVIITAVDSGDSIYYTVDGTQPGLNSVTCDSPCSEGLSVGVFTTIDAIEVATGSGAPIASNVAQGVFTESAPTSLAITLSPNPTTGATLTATATITPTEGVSSVTGTVSFSASLSSSFNPVTLCSQVAVEDNGGSWQAVCNFVEDSAGSYVVAAAYSGDELNLASNNTAPLTVVLGSTPILGTISGDPIALAINSNNSSGLAYNAVLNSDSSVSLLLGGALLSGQGCPAFSSLSSGISSGAVYVDFANSNIYLAMLAGGDLYAAYESIDQLGNCTQGPLLTLSTEPLGSVQMNVDPAQGNVYILNSYGAFPDTLYILPTAPWSASSLPTPAKLSLDYSVQYGPIVIDPSNHLVYINDLGGNTAGTVGTYSTAGFFVYEPNPTPALQHVTSYTNSSGTTPFNVGTLLTNGAGKLVLINENPHAFTANLSVPITVIDTTQTGFSFSNPGAALSTISATSPYTSIGGADIDTVNNAVYAFAFNVNASGVVAPGLLLEYNLAPGAATPETVLSGSTATPNLGYSAPWNRLNYNPYSTELVLSASVYGSDGLAFTSPLCAGTPLSLTQVAGSAANPLSIGGYPVVNATSGYVYAIGSGGIDYVAPPPGCNSTPTYTIGGSVSGLAIGTSVTLRDNVSDSVTVTNPATSFIFPTALDSGASYSVTVGIQPVGETCTVSAGSGVVATSNVTNVAVTCQANAATYTIGGTISGLSGSGLVLQNNGGNNLSITSNGSFTFSTSIASGGTYDITVLTQPSSPAQTCAVTGGSGTASANVASVQVACTTTIIPTYTIGGTVSGLSGTGLALQDNGDDNLSVATDGNFTFPTALDSGAHYAVTVGTQPVGETCTVSAGSGVVATSNVTNVAVTCGSSGPAPAQVTDIETITVSDTETIPDVVDSEPITVTDMVSVTISLIITGPSSLPAGFVGVPYSATFAASGGSGTGYIWSITSGGSALSAVGLSLSTAGILSGTPSAAGTYPVTVQVADSAGNMYSANFSLTIAPSAPIANLSTTLLTFAPQASGTASATQTVTLTNTGNAPLSFTGSGITISGANATDFSQTNQCPSSVAAGSNCPINVTFTPISPPSGIVAAELNVADDAGGSPQQVGLSGIVLPSTSVSCTIPPLTLSADSATDQITCAEDLTNPAPLGPIALVCNLPTSLSKYITCSFSPNSLNFSSTFVSPCTAPYTACTTLTIQPATAASLERKSWPWAASSGGVAFGAVLWLPAWLFVSRRKKGKSKHGLLLLFILLCGLPAITSCGGKSGPPTPPAGTYQASIVLTGPGLNETLTFTIQAP